jgi:hypothetical protein
MFPIEASEVGEEAIDQLVMWMEDEERNPRTGDNTKIPAGFTYLGQFIDHDITFDPTSKLDQLNDPGALVNFRTPRFDLDSVYGSGPKVQPYLYDWKDSKPPGTRLLVGHNEANDDLPRNQQGRALIGDARNDENVIVAQLHLLFIHLHNAVIDGLCDHRAVGECECFEEAQRLVRWHYQWIVVHEFLPKVVGETMAGQVFERGGEGAAPTVHRKYFTWQREPFIPVEFSGAAYRFGHSMVRAHYGLQRRPKVGPRPRPTALGPLLEGFTWLPQSLVIEWERFFALPGSELEAQSSLKIDTAIASPLFGLPDKGGALPRRNLLRGRALGLPSGQAVAGEMDAPALSEDELLLDTKVPRRAREALMRATPLWFYILCEAASELGDRGRHLGPVGGQIVAEVLVGLLEADPSSYLCKQPDWRPTELEPEGEKGRGDFTMADLVKFARPSG